MGYRITRIQENHLDVEGRNINDALETAIDVGREYDWSDPKVTYKIEEI